MAIKHPIVALENEAKDPRVAASARHVEERLKELEHRLEESKSVASFSALAAKSKVSFLIAAIIGTVTVMVFATACLMALFGEAKDVGAFISAVSPILMFSLGALLTYVFGHFLDSSASK